MEKKAIKNIALQNPAAAAAALCSMDSLKENIFLETSKRVMKEVVSFSKKPECILKSNSARSVTNLTNTQLYQQLYEQCPHLICFLVAICKSGQPKAARKSILHGENMFDINSEMRNAVCAAACICLKQYNQKLSAYHYRNGLLLLHGGVKAKTLQRCYQLGITVSQKSCIRMQEKFGVDFDEKVVSWTERTKETELMIRFLEELKREGSQLIDCDGASFNLSDVAVRDLLYYDESLYEQCAKQLRESGLQGDQISLKHIDEAISQLRSSLVHFK